MEIFKDIPGYEGFYQVSNFGNVKSLERQIYRKDNTIKPVKCRILKKGISPQGYNVVNLSKNGKVSPKTVHQLVAITFLGHKPDGFNLVVNHKNFIRTDNRVENLEIVTMRYNVNHTSKHMTSKHNGVSYVKSNKNWTSSIYINNKRHRLGYFKTEEEASLYYNNALIDYELGNEIKTKLFIKTSKYKGITYDKKANKWIAKKYSKTTKKQEYLGIFNSEKDAYDKILEKDAKNIDDLIDKI